MTPTPTDEEVKEALELADGTNVVHHNECPFFIRSRCRDPHDRCECAEKAAPILARHARALEAKLEEATKADARHALTCPQHVKNVDSWVRESALKNAEGENVRLRGELEEYRSLAEYVGAAKAVSRAEAAESALAAMTKERDDALSDLANERVISAGIVDEAVAKDAARSEADDLRKERDFYKSRSEGEFQSALLYQRQRNESEVALSASKDRERVMGEALKIYQVALGKIDKMRWDSNGASDSRNFIEACMVASKAMEDAVSALAANPSDGGGR